MTKNIFESYKTTVLGLVILAVTIIYQFKAIKFAYEVESVYLIFAYGFSIGLILAPDKVLKVIFARIKGTDSES